jgi:hypothetical protein
MKKFIIASLIFLIVAVIGIVLDALLMYTVWEAMPNIIYYGLGWLSAGIYISIAYKKKQQ